MVDEKTDLSLDGENTQKIGSKKKLIIIIAAVVLLLVVVLCSYFFFFSEPDTETGQIKEGEEASSEMISAIYVPMPSPFVFNVSDGTRDRLVQIKVQLMVRGDENAALARKHTPLLQGTLTRVFGALTIDQLRSPMGKTQLRIFTLQALNDATMKVENKAIIYSVLFTGFVLQ